ncbi:MAG: hypothetical protein HOE90_01915 [Bacteriovoracaceae bacterium]|jgi:hypothetical protein|nr:hypothetical protein [Bacteriovoracaceae bacterium]
MGIKKLLTLFISIFFTAGLAAQDFTVKGAHTEEELEQANDYYNEQYHDDKYNELCASSEKATKLCEGNTDSTFDMLIESASKAYSAFMPMLLATGGGSFKISKAETKGADTAKGEGKAEETNSESSKKSDSKKDDDEKEVQDFCAFIPMAGEAGAAAWNAIEQSKIENDVAEASEDTRQREYISAMANTHDTYRKTSLTKAITYSSTSVCYLGLAATNKGLVKQNAGQFILKFGSASILAGYYFAKMEKHRKYRDMANELAAQLPGLGECAPTTDPQCYCAQTANMYDPQYCLPTEAGARITSGQVGVACVDGNLQADPSCNCATSNTCFKTAFNSTLGGMDLGGAYAGATGPIADALSTGSYDGASGEALAGQLMAISRKMAAKDPDLNKALATFNSSGGSGPAAEALMNAGIPRLSAAFAASLPSNAGSKNFRSNSKGSFGRKLLSRMKRQKRSKKVRYGTNRRRGRSKSKKYAKGKKSKRPKASVLRFAEKAHNSAQINKDSSKQIFDILSHRYRMSGWEKLNLNN